MKLTRRGKVVALLALVLLLWGIGLVATHFWWTSAGICWGSADKCLLGGL